MPDRYLGFKASETLLGIETENGSTKLEILGLQSL